MLKQTSALLLCFLFLCVTSLFFTGCGSKNTDNSQEPPVFSTPQVLTPEAPGTDTIGQSPLTLDISNISQGYLTACSDDNGTTKNIQLSAMTELYILILCSPEKMP